MRNSKLNGPLKSSLWIDQLLKNETAKRFYWAFGGAILSTTVTAGYWSSTWFCGCRFTWSPCKLKGRTAKLLPWVLKATLHSGIKKMRITMSIIWTAQSLKVEITCDKIKCSWTKLHMSPHSANDLTWVFHKIDHTLWRKWGNQQC